MYSRLISSYLRTLLTEQASNYFSPGTVSWDLKKVQVRKLGIDPKMAGQLLRKIKFVETPLGRVYISEKVLEHTDDNPNNEPSWRRKNVKYGLLNLEKPQEIWQGYNGNYVFVNLFDTFMLDKNKQPKRVTLFVVSVTSKRGRWITFYCEKNDIAKMEKYRHGKLIYKDGNLI